MDNYNILVLFWGSYIMNLLCFVSKPTLIVDR
jgi:hypothetical protein